MSPDSAWSIALVTRLRTIRSTRRTSASARHGRLGDFTTTLVPRWSASAWVMCYDAVCHVDEVDVVDVEHRGAGVEPADLEQVAEEALEAVQLGLEQLRGPGGRRVELGPRVVEHVTRHPHRRQRGPELVGDVRDEPALDAAQLLELFDLALQVRGHLVEGDRETRDVVVAGHPEPLLELARRQPLGNPAGESDRGDDLLGDQPGDAGHQHQQQHAGGQQRPGDEPEGLFLLIQREQVVDRVGRAVGRQADPGAHHDPRHVAAAVVYLMRV